MTKIALVTHSQLPNLGIDDRLLLETLEERNVLASSVIWNDPSVAWESFDAVIRSTWDYYERPREFLAWLTDVEQRTRLWNPAKLIRWNMHTTYLRDLAASGIPTVPTKWLYQGETVNLLNELHVNGWVEAVIKPTIPASAYHTWRTSIDTAIDDNSKLVAEVKAHDMMIQQYIPAFETEGEWSFMFFGNQFSHAVLKTLVKDDFHMHGEDSERLIPQNPPEDVIQQAQAIVDAVEETWLYARVDGVIIEDILTVVELKLIEPTLFLSMHSEAASNFADALMARL